MGTPALRKVFEAVGVGLIPLLEGAVFLVQELSAAGKAVEVIALGKHRGGSGAVPAPGGLSGVTPPPAGAPATGSGGVQHPPPSGDPSPAFGRAADLTPH